jgi:hypothetical protein
LIRGHWEKGLKNTKKKFLMRALGKKVEKYKKYFSMATPSYVEVMP